VFFLNGRYMYEFLMPLNMCFNSVSLCLANKWKISQIHNKFKGTKNSTYSIYNWLKCENFPYTYKLCINLLESCIVYDIVMCISFRYKMIFLNSFNANCSNVLCVLECWAQKLVLQPLAYYVLDNWGLVTLLHPIGPCNIFIVYLFLWFCQPCYNFNQ